MFGNLMGNMEEQQKALKSKLSNITIDAESGGGAVKVTVNANKELVNISLNKDALDWDDVEQLENFILVAINEALKKAEEKAGIETQKLVQDMLPPGFADMFGA